MHHAKPLLQKGKNFLASSMEIEINIDLDFGDDYNFRDFLDDV